LTNDDQHIMSLYREEAPKLLVRCVNVLRGVILHTYYDSEIIEITQILKEFDELSEMVNS